MAVATSRSRRPEDLTGYQEGGTLSLRDEVTTIPYQKREYVHRELEKQGESVEEFEALLADREIQPSSILAALRRRKIDVARGTVYTWATRARDE